MRWMLTLAAIALASCADNRSDAEKRYEIVKRNGTVGEACNAGREVADFYLRAGDEEQYRLWDAISGIDCQLADFKGFGAPASADDQIISDEVNRVVESVAKATSQTTVE